MTRLADSQGWSSRLFRTSKMCSSVYTLCLFVTIAMCVNLCESSRLHRRSRHYHSSEEFRYRRDVSRKSVSPNNPIPENIQNDVMLFNLAQDMPGFSFEVTGNTAKADIFYVFNNEELRLKKELPEDDRKSYFDFEKYPTLSVEVNATSNQNSSDVTMMTVNLELSDVNDENPMFTNEPVPFYATMSRTPVAGTVVYTVTATDPDTNPSLKLELITDSTDQSLANLQSRFSMLVTDQGNKVKIGQISINGGSFNDGPPIHLQVRVTDENGISGIKQERNEYVTITIGTRAPQIYKASYTGQYYENSEFVQGTSNQELEIKVLAFQQGSLTFELLDSNNQASQLFDITDRKIKSRMPVDYETNDQKRISLTIRVNETFLDNGSTRTLSSKSSLEINIIDENDNAPQFKVPTYSKTLAEDAAIGTTVITVTASDPDTGANGEIVFSLSSNGPAGNFFIETRVEIDSSTGRNQSVGTITVASPLDYDDIASHRYEFIVRATDRGVNQQSSTANIIVTVTNVNDNNPLIDNSSSPISLREGASVNTIVIPVRASDRDGDKTSFSISSSNDAATQNLFKINPESGLVQTQITIPRDIDVYELKIKATDDGSCCNGGVTKTSEAIFIINILGDNTNKPEFTQCNTYDTQADVKEQTQVGENVFKVQAFDGDRGINGEVRYFMTSPDPDDQDPEMAPFRIDEKTGQITVKYGLINRKDWGSYIQVTVKGRNPMDVPLMEGWCTFRVALVDINDNAPRFELTEYGATVQVTATANTVIRTMEATDQDIGVNANITYEIDTASDPNAVFKINRITGVLSTAKALSSDTARYILHIIANDNGKDPGPKTGTTAVTINVNMAGSTLPEWIGVGSDKTFNVPETAPIAYVITTLECKSNIPNLLEVNFIVFDTTADISLSSSFFGYESFNNGSGVDTKYFMKLTLLKPLDYLLKQEHRVNVVCRNTGPVSETDYLVVQIDVEDKNNQIPVFTGFTGCCYEGSIAENAQADTEVIVVSAEDKDATPPFNEVTFALAGPDSQFFKIESLSGNRARILTTQNLASVLDRETKDSYDIQVTAFDGAPAAYPEGATQPNRAQERSVRVRVTDVNDNNPYFKKSLYQCQASEDLDINQLVPNCIVKAEDPDELDQVNGLTYIFTDGNNKNMFSISKTGNIRLNGELDFEDDNEPKTYILTLVARDGVGHENQTRVEISVIDANDNSPVFGQGTYIVDGVFVEEAPPPNGELLLTTVTATDADKSREETDIQYSLSGSLTSGSNRRFRIDPATGSIYLTGALDREDEAGPTFNFNVVAEDERMNGRLGYATVKVTPKDINDNGPSFLDANTRGFVDENSPRDTYVMQVLATDPDAGDNGTVQYRKAPDGDQSNQVEAGYFSISQDGEVKTNTAKENLDREKTVSMSFVAEAYDLGNPSKTSTQTITITLNDINDQAPYFEKPLYSTTMSENTKSGEIMRIEAIDNDSAAANKNLQYTIKPLTVPFGVNSLNNVAYINVSREVDYEKLDQRNFTFTLEVTDGLFNNETQIFIKVEDFNDNAPKFKETDIKRRLAEEQPPGLIIPNVVFEATDADSGINKEFTFSVVRESDKLFEFYIEPTTGVVSTRKPLDREAGNRRTITIMAQDKGDPPQNSNATLSIELLDINDNAPTFAEDYRPRLKENEAYPADYTVVEVMATDLDASPNADPFKYTIPADCTDPACSRFRLVEVLEGNGGKVSALVKTAPEGESITFDREDPSGRKVYHLPIVIRDMADIPGDGFQSATNTLTIVIEDLNDNRHLSGHQDISALKYEGLSQDLIIGRVYAKDQDDWDLPDKTFTYIAPANLKDYFSVNSMTGDIEMYKDIPNSPPNQPYRFEVDVYDKVFKDTARCTVAVTVAPLSDEAVRKSGAIRLKDVTAADFLYVPETANGKSIADKFKDSIAKLLGYPNGKDHVEITSMIPGEGTLDILYAAHGSPYLKASQLESAVMLNRATLARDTGVTIGQSPINLCMEEVFDTGCYTNVNVTGNPVTVNANGTSFVGAEVIITAKPGCIDAMFPEPAVCQGDYCFNGGTCNQDDWGKLSCSCLSGFDGPRCQQRRHNFDGSAVSFYKTLAICAEGRTSFEFITEQADGVLMYTGPTSRTDEGDSIDFLAIQLINGFLKFRLNLGAGELVLDFDKRKLNDGKWHKIVIDRDHQHIQMIIDDCDAATTDSGGMVIDWSVCLADGTVPGGDILLNVATFLQLGGRWKDTSTPTSAPTTPVLETEQGFIGCVKNLMHDSKLYDLFYKDIPGHNSGINGCPKEEQICGESTTTPQCGTQATCISEWSPDSVKQCICHPGFYGNKCENEAPVIDLETNSFLQWQMDQATIDASVRDTAIDLMFRTRQDQGNLFTMTHKSAGAKILVQIRGGLLEVSYDMGGGVQVVGLSHSAANTGQWHSVSVRRYGNEMVVAMDGGEGRKFSYNTMDQSVRVTFEPLAFVSAGARVPPVPDVDTNDISDDLIKTCLKDVRINNKWLPMSGASNSNPSAGATLNKAQFTQETCERDDCIVNNCVQGVCVPLWGKYECRCADGALEVLGVCPSPCTTGYCHKGLCAIEAGLPVCTCDAGWVGDRCRALRVVEEDASNAGMIVGVVIAVLLLLILVVLLVLWLVCRRRDNDEKNILKVDPDDDFIRENVIFYDEEGAGEEDHNAYDLTLLTREREAPFRPDTAMRTNTRPVGNEVMETMDPGVDRPDVGSFIDKRIADAEDPNDDPFNDSTHDYNYEGGNSDAGSLSSLNSSSTDASQDYDYLRGWGDKFARLADMYGAGQEGDD